MEGVGRPVAEEGPGHPGVVNSPGGARAATGTEAKPMHPRPPAETKTGHERDDYGRRPGRPRGVRVGPPGPGGRHRGPAPQGHAYRARRSRTAGRGSTGSSTPGTPASESLSDPAVVVSDSDGFPEDSWGAVGAHGRREIASGCRPL